MHRALLVLFAVLPGVAYAGPHRDAVLDLLNAYEATASRAELEKIGDGVDAELMEIADDATVPSSRRGRAVSALAFYPTDAVRAFLEARLETSDKSLLRRKAAYALGEAWGADVVPVLARVLGDADVQVRIAAATALGTIGDDAARAALKARLPAETEDAVREVIVKSVGGGQ